MSYLSTFQRFLRSAQRRPELSSGFKRRYFLLRSWSSTLVSDEETPLVTFSNARLAWPGDDGFELAVDDFSVFPVSMNRRRRRRPRGVDGAEGDDERGGYALLGRNGAGKTLLVEALRAAFSDDDDEDDEEENSLVRSGSVAVRAGATVAHASFASHVEAQRSGATAWRTIAPVGRLNKTAEFLVVRFGLYPLLHRTVDTLSTGEMRKVLLVRALSQRPDLLILENATDGLDPASRRVVTELLSRTLRGFSTDVLVQGVSADHVSKRTQVLSSTHRPEELDEVRELDAVVWWETTEKENTGTTGTTKWRESRRRRRPSESSDDLPDRWSSGRGISRRAVPDRTTSDEDGGDDLPDERDLRDWWREGRNDDENDVLVSADALTIRRGDATLLNDLSWTVRRGERWIVGGGNGAGKSTLSRLLARRDDDATTRGSLTTPDVVGWVSTESHVESERRTPRNITVEDLLRRAAARRDPSFSSSSTTPLPRALRSLVAALGVAPSLLARPYHQLSQGEQKAVLLAAALAPRPSLLVLDEPTQGLDITRRRRLARALRLLCRVVDVALVHVTHRHGDDDDDDEALPDLVTHALHLRNRRAAYQGPIRTYRPTEERRKDEREYARRRGRASNPQAAER